VSSVRTCRAGDEVVEDLAEARRRGPELGALEVLGEVHGPEPLAHDLTGAVEVGAVLEE
jgi:hypothetical protein